MIVKLTEKEVNLAKEKGKKRDDFCKMRCINDYNATNEDNARTNYYGILTEMAAAKHFKIKHRIKDHFTDEEMINKDARELDVKYFEVRSMPAYGRLCVLFNHDRVRVKDKPIPYLFIKRFSDYDHLLLGWQWGHVIKHPENYRSIRDDWHNYHVPTNTLRPLNELHDYVYRMKR